MERPDYDTFLIEKHVYEITNLQKAERCLDPLKRIVTIDDITRAYSQDMVKCGFYDHVDPDGHKVRYRFDQAGYDCTRFHNDGQLKSKLGENLDDARVYKSELSYPDGPLIGYDWYANEKEVTEKIVSDWMNSLPYRHNILDDGFVRIGVGIVFSTDGTVAYATQNFC